MAKKGKWKAVEAVVAEIEAMRSAGLSPGVTRNAMVGEDAHPDRKREIDVLVRFPVGPRTMSIGISVKDHGRRLSVGVVGAEIRVWEKRRRSIDRYCIVSTSGFTPAARRDAEEAGVECVHLQHATTGPKLIGRRWFRSLAWARFEHREGAGPAELDALAGATDENCFLLQHNGGQVPMAELFKQFFKEWERREPTPSKAEMTVRWPFDANSAGLVIEGTRWPLPTALVVSMRAEPLFEEVPAMHFRGLFEEGLREVSSGAMVMSGGHKMRMTAIGVPSDGNPNEEGWTTVFSGSIRIAPEESPKRTAVGKSVAKTEDLADK